MLRALEDKQLLLDEAQRRGLLNHPDIVRQVQELQTRLAIQKLLEVEQHAHPPSEADLRAYFGSHPELFQKPAAARVARVLAASPAQATTEQHLKAQRRAQSFELRLRKGEPAGAVARAGDGPERDSGGDLGFLDATSTGVDPVLLEGALGLRSVGQVSQVLKCAQGFAVLVLMDLREARLPSFEEARAEVQARITPVQQRAAFERLLNSLRSGPGLMATAAPQAATGEP